MGNKHRRNRNKQLQKGANDAPSVFDANLNPLSPVPDQLASPTPSATRRMMMEFQAFAGPIPPPAILGEYEQVCPGAADRILTQVEEQGRHRRKLEQKAINYNVASATIAQIAGLILFLVAIGAGTFLLYHDKQVGGLGSIITAVGGAAWVLVKAESRKKKDLAEKREGKRKE